MADKLVRVLLILLAILILGCIEQQTQASSDTQELENLVKENKELKDRLRNLEKENEYLREEINKIEKELKYAKTPPYILIQNREVHIVFKKTTGEVEEWVVPFESLEASLKLGYLTRDLIPNIAIPTVNRVYEIILPLCVYADCTNFIEEYNEAISELQEMSIQYVKLKGKSKTYTVIDYRSFVDPQPFTEVISSLYSESPNDDAFIREVWNIVTQLTAYSSEIEETPRYPLETFLSGGGDCEDTAILFASMIKAAPVDWDIELVYMDADNPKNPKEVNHVMVYINTGQTEYLIETTNDQIMQPYEEVVGWYFKI